MFPNCSRARYAIGTVGCLQVCVCVRVCEIIQPSKWRCQIWEVDSTFWFNVGSQPLRSVGGEGPSSSPPATYFDDTMAGYSRSVGEEYGVGWPVLPGWGWV